MATLSAKGCFKKANAELKRGDIAAAFTVASKGDGKGGHLKVRGYYRNKAGAIKGPRTFSPFMVDDRVDPGTGEVYQVATGWDSFATDVTEMRLDRWVEGAWNFVPEFAASSGPEVLVGVAPETKGRFVNPNKCGVPRLNQMTGNPLVDGDGTPLLTKSYEELVADT